MGFPEKDTPTHVDYVLRGPIKQPRDFEHATEQLGLKVKEIRIFVGRSDLRFNRFKDSTKR